MKVKTLIILVISLTSVLYSCKKDDNEQPHISEETSNPTSNPIDTIDNGSQEFLSLDSYGIYYDYSRDKSSFRVTSSSRWEVTENEDWVSISVDRGLNKVTVFIEENFGPNLRKGIITVTMGKLTKTYRITQQSR